MGISASHLSRVMNGKKSLSLEMIVRIAQELEIDLSLEKMPGPMAGTSRTVDLEVFKVIADWYHFPILELTNTKGFKSDEKWIAKRLGMPLSILKAALDRLESLELIERVDGKIRATGGDFLETTNDIPSGAIRKHHEQMLAKAAEALNADSPELREFQAMNLGFNPEDLGAAKEMIREFYKRFNKKFSRASGKEIYQMNLQFFKLTQEIK